MPKKHECIHCKSTETRYYKYDWRPCHWWDKTVYILHQRVHCKECGGTFATIDKSALATLPTRIIEQFPFMFPSKHSPGLYSNMLLMLITLMPHSILFGTFANTINKLQHIRFAETHVSYLDEAYHWMNDQQSIAVNCGVPTPFSPFADQGGYCGIELLPSLLVCGLKMFMSTHESYMQALFQFGVDEGCSTDDSHKLTKHVYVNVGKRKVQPFNGTYTILGLNGKVNVSRFRYTKSTGELMDIIPDWARVRENAGQPELLRLEGDNAAGDSSQQLSASPSLLKGVVPYEENTTLPRYFVSTNDYR